MPNFHASPVPSLALAVALTLGLAPAALATPDAKPSEKPAADKPAAKPAESPDEYGPPVVAPPGGLAPKKPTEPPSVNEAKTLIKSIAVRGNQRIGDDRILLSIPISPGDKVGRSEVMDAIQRIYGMGYFQDVKAGSEPVAGEFVDGLRARRQRRNGARIVEIDAAQHLSAVHLGGCGGCRGGPGHPVVEFER